MMDQKRKYTVGKNVFLFTNDWCGKKIAALYEFKISVTKMGDGKYVVDSFYNQGEKLKAIETFYGERIIPKIFSVAACVLGPNLLYLIPHDENSVLPSDVESDCFMTEEEEKLLVEERETLAPCLFDLSQKKKSNLRIEFPLARKNEPRLIFIGNKVFALSSPSPYVRCPEPCFESLVVTHDDNHDVTFKHWTPLNCPGFHSSIEKLVLCVTGIAVLEEEGLILVSIVDYKSSYFSYNIHSEKWSPVCMDRVADTRNEDGFLIPSYLHENAAVVNNNIYTYYSDYKKLLVFPYAIASGGDLLLESVCEVRGFEFQENNEHMWDHDYETSGTVTKVEDQVLCVIHTMCPCDLTVQNLCITFVQLVGDGKKCTTLKSFTCTLSNGTEFHRQAIKSCFVLDEEKSDHHRGKRAVLSNYADDGASSQRVPENTF